MRVSLTDGQTLRAQHDPGWPISNLAVQGDHVSRKFHSLVAPILGIDRGELIAGWVDRLETLTRADELMDLCN